MVFLKQLKMSFSSIIFKLEKKIDRSYRSTFIFSVAGSIFALFRTRNSYFWMDDFVWLPVAHDSPFSLSLYTRNLFTHFSPMTGFYLSVVDHFNDSWETVRMIMFFTLLLSGMSIAFLARQLNVNRIICAILALLWITSVVQIRSTTYFMGLISTVPVVAFILFAAG